MAQRQFRTDDTSIWADRFGTGSDGAHTVNSAVADATQRTTCTGSASSTALTVASGAGFSVGDLLVIHQTQGTGFGNWELNKISSLGGGTNWTLAYDLMNTYGTGAQVQQLRQYSSVDIQSSGTYSAATWNGSSGGILVLLSLTSITVSGTISASGSGYDGGDGGVGGGTHSNGVQGESGTGVGARVITANGAGGGGGESRIGSDAGGGGGGGGHAASGSNGTNGNAPGDPEDGGTGGGTAGSASLVTVVFGGAGGGGGIDDSTTGGVGGNSGGFVLLIAPTITVTGSVQTNGSNGTSHGDSGGGGGGGAGGSVLMKGQRVTIGTNLVTCAAGTGAPGNSAFGGVGGNGGNGAVGRIHIDYSQTLSGSTTPTLDSSVDAVLNDLPNNQNYTLLM